MSLYIDGREFPADPERNLLDFCLSQGFNLPYFCWHPALGSVGACRQCAVKKFKDEHDTHGRLVMACMTPASDGLRVSIEDAEARDFRADIIAWLMTNHPHDCPVCDEGGECHLQDMTVMTGHAYRRYRGPKRTFRNQYLGPFVNHEMNRCIACYRCVRFYRDYAGGDDLEALASRNHVYFGRAAEGALESEFSGNLVEVCPTGVFTDATIKPHYVRKWDVQFAPSLCAHCGLGCNTLVGERYGELQRLINRYHPDINGYFLCDRGRYGSGYMSGAGRVRTLLFRDEAGEPLRLASAIGPAGILPTLTDLLRQPGGLVGIGSPRASLEANFALKRLVGEERFFAGVADAEWRCIGLILDLMRRLPVPAASPREVEDCDAALVLGEDVMATAPRLGLALRRSTRHAALAEAGRLKLPDWDAAAVQVAGKGLRSPLVLATFAATRLDDAASATLHGPPEDLLRFAKAVVHELAGEAPDTYGLDEARRQLAAQTAQALRAAARPVVVAGCQGGEALIRAAANIALALRRLGKAPKIAWVQPEANSLGLALLGARPLAEALATVRQAGRPTTLVLENDLYRRASRQDVDALLGATEIVVIDHTRHSTLEAARAVLPAATVGDGSGTLVNGEGRAQRYLRAWLPAGEITDSWRWLGRLARLIDSNAAAWERLDEVVAACAASLPGLAGIAHAAPGADFRLVGEKIPRRPHRYSGRTAMHADRSVHEPPTPADPDTPLSFSMEGHADHGQKTPASLITFYWSPGWNSVQALNKFQQEVGGELRGGDPGVRLVPPAADWNDGFLAGNAGIFTPHREEWLLLPRHLVFGSEELSMQAAAVAQRAGPPELRLHPDDLARLGLLPGGTARITVGGESQHMAVCPDASLTLGTAALPIGLPGQSWVELPAWGSIVPEPPPAGASRQEAP